MSTSEEIKNKIFAKSVAEAFERTAGQTGKDSVKTKQGKGAAVLGKMFEKSVAESMEQAVGQTREPVKQSKSKKASALQELQRQNLLNRILR